MENYGIGDLFCVSDVDIYSQWFFVSSSSERYSRNEFV